MARIGSYHCQNRTCARPIQQSGGGGRPRKFCSQSCRRAVVDARVLACTGRPRSHKRGGGVATSPFGLLIAWLRSGQDLQEPAPESTDTVRPGPAEPAVGPAEWFDRHRLY